VSQILDVDAVVKSPDPHAMLLADLAEFVTHHRPCGQLTGDASEPAPDGYMLSVGCFCGVTFLRWVTPDAAALDLDPPDARHSVLIQSPDPPAPAGTAGSSGRGPWRS
jgi:hypothetical protein